VKLLLSLLLTITCLGLAALSFEAEELSFKLAKGYWEMDGLFHFASYADEAVSVPIFFPIPADSLCLQPKLLALEVVEDSLASCRLTQQTKSGLYFVVNMPPQHFCTVRIAYSQELLGKHASYIITTANAWGRPLNFASYKLMVDNGITVNKLPFPAQTQTVEGYYWEFYDFSPKGEFEIEFY